MPEIKVFLKARKVPVGGKKADLLARLSAALKGHESLLERVVIYV